jgi:hypothetical protein
MAQPGPVGGSYSVETQVKPLTKDYREDPDLMLGC